MKRYLAQEDVEQWLPLIAWLNPQAAAGPSGEGPPAGGQETQQDSPSATSPPLTAVVANA